MQEFARQNGVNLKITYKGSVDIMLELEKGKSSQYDAILPADRIWIELGDTQHVVKNVQSIYRSPVIFGVKRSVAQRLGWIGKDVTVADILAAAKAGKLRYMMTSATQSNSAPPRTWATCTPSPAIRTSSASPTCATRRSPNRPSRSSVPSIERPARPAGSRTCSSTSTTCRLPEA